MSGRRQIVGTATVLIILDEAGLDVNADPGAGRPLGLVDCGRGEFIQRDSGLTADPRACAPIRQPDRPGWAAMNDRHNRRAGRRSSVIPRVICPA